MRQFTGFIIPILIALALGTWGCEKAEPDAGDADDRDFLPGSWVTWSPYKWAHDGYPVTGNYCKLYSDGVMREKRPELVRFADNTFMGIMEEFQFTRQDEFAFPPGYSHIHVYLNLENEPAIAATFWGSVLITVQSNDPDTTRLAYLMKHELTHTLEYLIEGRAELGTDVWFREGLAVYCGSNGSWDHVSTVDDLEDWMTRNEGCSNGGNPISIHQWEDFPEGSDITGYYTVFDAVMKYLLDENGLAKSYNDVLALFFEIREGTAFPDAFEMHFGISLDAFEEEIFERLEAWLPNPFR
jgi:hypothetical protein